MEQTKKDFRSALLILSKRYGYQDNYEELVATILSNELPEYRTFETRGYEDRIFTRYYSDWIDSQGEPGMICITSDGFSVNFGFDFNNNERFVTKDIDELIKKFKEFHEFLKPIAEKYKWYSRSLRWR